MNEYLYQIIAANGRMSNTNGKISKQIDIFPFAERYSELFFFSQMPIYPSWMRTAECPFPVNMYYSSPIRLAEFNYAKGFLLCKGWDMYYLLVDEK